MSKTDLLSALVLVLAAAGCKGSSSGSDEAEPAVGGKKQAGDARLSALPYLNITAHPESQQDKGTFQSGVLKADLEKASPGYNLYNNHYRNRALLMDLQGEIVHEWKSDAGQSKVDETYRWTIPPYLGWHHIEMDRAGNLYTIVGYPPHGGTLVALDWESKPKWELAIGAHHDIALGDEPGEVYTLPFHLKPWEVDGKTIVLEEEEVVRVKDGKVVATLSLNELLMADDELAPLLRRKIARLADKCTEAMSDRGKAERTVYRKILYHYLDLYSTGRVLTHDGLEKIELGDEIEKRLARLSRLFLSATVSEADRAKFRDAFDGLYAYFRPRAPENVKKAVDASLDRAFAAFDPDEGLTDRSPEALLEISNYCKANAIHSNTIEVMPEDRPGLWKKGDLLLSFRQLDLIAVVRWNEKGTSKVVWHFGPEGLSQQHQPALTPDGTILVFDNGVDAKRSRVVEIDPETKKIVWSYGDNKGDKSFYSWWKGGSEQLPNGNVLIANTVTGEVFEVTKEDREIVWYFVAPGDSASNVAQVYRFMRIPEDVVHAIDPSIAKN